MEIETKRASLDTMSVTIRALHVDGKQMTLAVFRQLPRWATFNKSGHLADCKWWGTVEYRIDTQSAWLVGEHQGRLIRCGIGNGEESYWQLDEASKVRARVQLERVTSTLPQLFIAV